MKAIWFGGRDTEENTVGRAGDGRDEDVKVLFGRNEDGEDQESEYHRQHTLDILEVKLERPE